MFSHHSSTVVFLTVFALVVPAFTKVILHLGLSLSHSWLDIKLLYPHLKRIVRTFIWPKLLEYICCNKRSRTWGNFLLNQPSYLLEAIYISQRKLYSCTELSHCSIYYAMCVCVPHITFNTVNQFIRQIYSGKGIVRKLINKW